MIRCFLAVSLPEDLKEILREIQGRLAAETSGVRWVRPEGFHLTLKFFGNIPEEKLPALVRAAERVLQEFRPFELVLEGLGFFPESGPPRVVWVGLSGELEPLLEMERRLSRAFAKLGFPPEKRPFHPHITLGRVKDGRRSRELRARAAEIRVPPGRFRLDHLTFYQSKLHPEGALYSVLKEVPLGNA
ncbi:RNA 2',3'-cyclic phosphodiesterase [Thermosulfurimonas marina]|uniref:RNA 2',3'-cyclic phosphodiesterase n=1 Tax=Thermosulfurimonas marina TaxID=2047767 RepID=A0A6H1WT57_9BACT|nr:RNA 2',3'-cyclic phosphodiesterase [Thermosulfurimonas marina]QJA06306.1 RNA 2',3'-cyclic phosphodiesterase [Thermosulfurimonas marina]